MRCPFCGNIETQVRDSRIPDDGEAVKRRRYCIACDSRFTTYERVQLREIIVIKKNGDKKRDGNNVPVRINRRCTCQNNYGRSFKGCGSRRGKRSG